jgi:hypothetical protein
MGKILEVELRLIFLKQMANRNQMLRNAGIISNPGIHHQIQDAHTNFKQFPPRFHTGFAAHDSPAPLVKLTMHRADMDSAKPCAECAGHISFNHG